MLHQNLPTIVHSPSSTLIENVGYPIFKNEYCTPSTPIGYLQFLMVYHHFPPLQWQFEGVQNTFLDMPKYHIVDYMFPFYSMVYIYIHLQYTE